MKGLLTSFREKGIYTIARIVVFKDNLLAEKMPTWPFVPRMVRCGATGKDLPGWTLSRRRSGTTM